jgi:hypothetical protein
MFAFLTSDVFAKFLGGFVLGTIGILTLQPFEARTVAASTVAVADRGAL